MKSILLLVSLCFITSSTIAQDLFEKGYYINNEGTKIQGLIDVYPLNSPTVKIRFKKENSDDVNNISIAEIEEFQVSEFKFVRFNGRLDLNLDPSSSSEPDFNEREVFLRLIIEGDVNLYSYKESNSRIFFYSTQIIKPIQLINTKFYRNDGKLAYKRTYREQLQNVIQCESANDLINDAKYDKEDLTFLFKEYNSCLGSSTKRYSGLPFISSKYLNVSLSIGRTTYSVVANTQLNNIKIAEYKDNSIPNIAIELEQLLPLTRNMFSMWARGDYKNFSDEEPATFEGVDENSKLYYNTIEASLGARGYVGTGLIKGFIDLGMSKSFEVGDGVYIDYENRRDFTNPQFPLHFVFGLGVMVKNRFVLDTRLEYLDKRLSDQFSFEDINYSMLTVNLKFLLKSYYK